MLNPLNIPFSVLEQELAEMFYEGKGHSVKVICKADLDDGSLEVVYDYHFKGVYQSTHEHIFSKEKLEELGD